ncbi:MAG TPA: hypothetical protein VFY92_12540, partial [Hyphomicrobiaceae bacterium]|nr:hypothetical protein [Hyphomicrobiaceae bacterium]
MTLRIGGMEAPSAGDNMPGALPISALRPPETVQPELASAAVPARTSVALVHDWCPTFRGGERVLAELARQFQGASVFTLFDFLPRAIKDEYFAGTCFHTSIANRLPGVERYYRTLF